MTVDRPILFPSVPYVKKVKGNKETARRRSGNTARSLRSLQSQERAPPARTRVSLLYYPFSQNEGNGGNKWWSPPSPLSKILFPVRTLMKGTEGNEVARHV